MNYFKPVLAGADSSSAKIASRFALINKFKTWNTERKTIKAQMVELDNLMTTINRPPTKQEIAGIVENYLKNGAKYGQDAKKELSELEIHKTANQLADIYLSHSKDSPNSANFVNEAGQFVDLGYDAKKMYKVIRKCIHEDYLLNLGIIKLNIVLLKSKNAFEKYSNRFICSLKTAVGVKVLGVSLLIVNLTTHLDNFIQNATGIRPILPTAVGILFIGAATFLFGFYMQLKATKEAKTERKLDGYKDKVESALLDELKKLARQLH